MAPEAMRRFGDGEFRELLGVTRALRVMKLSMIPSFPFDAGVLLKDIVGDMQWPKLREIGLAWIQASEDELVHFLLKHQRQLRRISLSTIVLLSGTWESVFRRLSGQLPKLRKVKLRGEFCGDEGNGFDFDTSDYPAYRRHMLRDAIERFILEGGDFPDEYALEDADVYWNGLSFTDQEEDDFYHSRVQKDYGVVSNGYTSDGSVVSFGSDEFDTSM